MVIVCESCASDCSCRDCRCPVLGPLGTLCDDCKEAGCDVFYTPCRVPARVAVEAGELDESGEASW